jgi:hypothetical protein
VAPRPFLSIATNRFFDIGNVSPMYRLRLRWRLVPLLVHPDLVTPIVCLAFDVFEFFELPAFEAIGISGPEFVGFGFDFGAARSGATFAPLRGVIWRNFRSHAGTVDRDLTPFQTMALADIVSC